MDKMMMMIADELELDKKSAKAMECMECIHRYENTNRPKSKAYWKRRAFALNKELRQMEMKQEGTPEREQERFDLCLPDKEVSIIKEEKCICHCGNKHIQSVKE